MKSLRYIFATVITTLTIFTSVLYTSCNKNKCGSVTCQNGGSCVSDVCSCPSGYSGNTCGTSWSDALVGTFTCTRSSCSPTAGATTSWTSVITKAATNGGFTVSITNFDNANITVSATTDSANNIVIAPVAGSYGISATGSYAGGKINLTFTTSSASGVGGYTCRMLMTKN